jgi:hypothetical protein
LVEIIQMAFPGALPDAVAFLHQQTAARKPVGEHPDPDTYDDFRAKRRSAAKRKAEGNNLDNDREEESSRKRRWVQRRVVEDEMEVDTDKPVCDRLASRESFPEVAIETEWPAGLRMTDSPLSDVEGVAGPSGLSTEEKEKEKTPAEMEIEDVAGPSGDLTANAKPAEAPVKVEERKTRIGCDTRSSRLRPPSRSWKKHRLQRSKEEKR